MSFVSRLLWAVTLAVPLAGLAETLQVTGPITNVVQWVRTNEYVLNGLIYVQEGAELHIEAGTVVKGKPGSDARASALIVTRGGKIFAEGTSAQPIIFTAEADDVNDPTDLPLFQRGLWGGVVLLGKAQLNTTVDTAGNAASPKYEVFEGLPDVVINGQNVHRFGGDEDEDSSGVMRYVSIRHAGVVFAPNKELNGLSLGAVGRGTELEYIEAYGTADDGFEFFGGTVNTRYLVSAFNDDDGFDIDMGYRGVNQFWFAIQEPGRKDNGGEWNGEPNEVNTGSAPVADYEVWNGTWIGAGTNTVGNRGLNVRVYAAPEVYNSVLTEFGGSGLLVDAKSGGYVTNGLMQLADNVWWNFATNGVAVPVAENAMAEVFFTEASRSNVVADPMLRGISRDADGGLDPRPAAGSPLLSGARGGTNSWLRPVSYRGAFGSVNWASDWTFLNAAGVLTARGGGNPMPYAPASTEPPVAPMLTVSLEPTGLEITVNSEVGRTYQLQSIPSLDTTSWTNEGSPVEGTGGPLVLSQPVTTSGDRFFRVEVEEAGTGVIAGR